MLRLRTHLARTDKEKENNGHYKKLQLSSQQWAYTGHLPTSHTTRDYNVRNTYDSTTYMIRYRFKVNLRRHRSNGLHNTRPK
jgi:hypothetical protein